ncbi:MAG: hypothetical protein ACLTCB_09420 [Merdibacter sp.]
MRNSRHIRRCCAAADVLCAALEFDCSQVTPIPLAKWVDRAIVTRFKTGAILWLISEEAHRRWRWR